MSRIVACLLGMALAGLWVGPAASDDPKPLQLIHSPWIKICIVGTCFVGAEVRTECAPVAGAMLVERSGDAKRTLRVTLPSHVNVERGVRVVIGQSEPITASYAGCTRGVCEADYEAGADLVDRLKQGPTLVLEAMNAASSPVRVSLSLVDFATAYDGAPTEPKVREMLLRSRKEIEDLNAAEEARKARCERAAPLP